MSKSKHCRKTVFWVLVFLVGGTAGVIFSHLLLPWLAGFPVLSKIDRLSQLREGATIINRTERITITQETGFQEAVSRLANSVVAVRAERHFRLINQKEMPLLKPEVLARGAGFVLTSDGLIITANSLLPSRATRIIVTLAGKESEAEIIKQDELAGLALLRIEQINLPVVTLGEQSALKLGETVFLLAYDLATSTPVFLINYGYVKQVQPKPDFFLTQSVPIEGSLLANIKGEVFALSLSGQKNGQTAFAMVEEIRELLK